MNTNYRLINLFFLLICIAVLIFVLPSCIHIHHDKFGKEYNELRMQLGIPIIKDGWQRDVSIYYPAPDHYTSWFTDSRPKDITLPYHAYKTIYYNHDTLVAERDTYLNMDFKWFRNGKPQNDLSDTLHKRLAKYHALDITYVYRRVYNREQNFSNHSLGFNYSIMGEKDGFADVQNLNKEQAEEVLRGWNLQRLNY